MHVIAGRRLFHARNKGHGFVTDCMVSFINLFTYLYRWVLFSSYNSGQLTHFKTWYYATSLSNEFGFVSSNYPQTNHIAPNHTNVEANIQHGERLIWHFEETMKPQKKKKPKNDCKYNNISF